MKNNKIYIRILIFFAVIVAGSLLTTSCDEELPAADSIPDATPPSAGFSFSADPTDHLTVNFFDASTSATAYSWAFGDGGTSTEQNPIHTYATEGAYTVTLTSSDAKEASDRTTMDVEIVEPPLYEPFILEPGFEDNMLDGKGDGRDSWRVSGGDRPDGMGGVVQITSSPVRSGNQAAKLATDNTRAGYQEVVVVPNQDYIVSFYYTMKTSPAGTLTVAILGGSVDDPAGVRAATIASKTVNNQNDADEYIYERISFNSGANDIIVIYFINTDVECRLDDFDIINDPNS